MWGCWRADGLRGRMGYRLERSAKGYSYPGTFPGTLCRRTPYLFGFRAPIDCRAKSKSLMIAGVSLIILGQFAATPQALKTRTSVTKSTIKPMT
jgi:hypothetical protein